MKTGEFGYTMQSEERQTGSLVTLTVVLCNSKVDIRFAEITAPIAPSLFTRQDAADPVEFTYVNQ